MKKEINDIELEAVTGGRYFINTSKKLICFQNVGGFYTLKCSPYEAMEALDGLIGKYETEKEYDEACVALLQSKGWI